jgi:hypothetical protein
VEGGCSFDNGMQCIEYMNSIYFSRRTLSLEVSYRIIKRFPENGRNFRKRISKEREVIELQLNAFSAFKRYVHIVP